MSSDEELSDDINRWPSDPLVLFGIESTASRRDLKRAYSGLIRRFKPEHSPEQFRRLREAFEQLDQQFEWREAFERHRDAGNDTFANEFSFTDGTNLPPNQSLTSQPQCDAEPDASTIDIPKSKASPTPFMGSADQIWQSGLDGGEPRGVYDQLGALVIRCAATEVEFARLYWLLKVHPEFDPGRDPIQWLIDGLQSIGLNGRLLSILSVDVSCQTGNFASLLSDNLFKVESPSGPLVEFVNLRWQAARQLKQFSVIQTDIECLRRRFFDEPDGWQSLLCNAIRQLVLVNDESTKTILESVFDDFANTPTRLESNWVWDWSASIVALQDAWERKWKFNEGSVFARLKFVDLRVNNVDMKNPRLKQTQSIHTQLVKLVENTWMCHPISVRAELFSFCADLINKPVTSLYALVAISQASRPLLYRLLELIREHSSEDADSEFDFITPAVERKLRHFVCGDLWQNEIWYVTVLNYCVNEAVTPNDVATAIEKHQEHLPESALVVADVLRKCLPLACIVEAQRLVT